MSTAQPKSKFERIEIQLTPKEISEHDEIRREALEEFSPLASTFRPSGFGVPFYEARVAAGLTWYAVAKAAGLAEYRTVKEIESGNDVKLSSLQAVARVLALRISVEAS